MMHPGSSRLLSFLLGTALWLPLAPQALCAEAVLQITPPLQFTGRRGERETPPAPTPASLRVTTPELSFQGKGR